MTPSITARPRSPAQIEAVRRNGAKSRGPVTPEGKARSSKNALKHGLATPEHILLDGEDEAAFTLLYEALIEENEPESTTEAFLVHRLAVTFWKQCRADRLEAKLFANTDPPHFNTGEGIEPGDAEAFFDLRRFNVIRGYQARLSREVSRCLGELRRLEAARNGITTPRPANGNEPGAGPDPVTARSIDHSSRWTRKHRRRPRQQDLPSPTNDPWQEREVRATTVSQSPIPAGGAMGGTFEERSPARRCSSERGFSACEVKKRQP